MSRVDETVLKKTFDTIGERLVKVMDEDKRLKMADITLTSEQKNSIQVDLTKAGLAVAKNEPNLSKTPSEELSGKIVDEISSNPGKYADANRALNQMSRSANGLARMSYGGQEGIKSELLKGAKESIAIELEKPEIRNGLTTENVVDASGKQGADVRMANALQKFGKNPAILTNAEDIMKNFTKEGRSAPNGATVAVGNSAPFAAVTERQL